MPQKRRLCFVIADGGHARFVQPAPDNGLHTFEAVDSTTVHRKDHDLVSDREGRSFDSAGLGRHAYTTRTDPHDLAKERFARAVATWINEAAAADKFNEIVIVAPPHVMSDLMDGIDLPPQVRLLGSLAKDLVKTPDHELWPHLKEWVRPVHRA